MLENELLYTKRMSNNFVELNQFTLSPIRDGSLMTRNIQGGDKQTLIKNSLRVIMSLLVHSNSGFVTLFLNVTLLSTLQTRLD